MHRQLLSCAVLLLASLCNGQTLYLAGDSTMARGNGVIDGLCCTCTNVFVETYSLNKTRLGTVFGKYLSIAVVNQALGGRSARSFTEEGRFNTIVNTVKAGDFVVIEFGHNDGSAGAVDNGRQCAVGDSYDTTTTVKTSNGTSILIHSWPYYMQNAINSLKAKGAIPIISSQTPNNAWTNGAISPPSRFVGYAKLVGQRTSVEYVDHYAYVAQAFKRLGEGTINTYFPNDHTHTSPTGANVVAQTFVRGLLCGNSTLKSKVNAAGQGVPDRCLPA